ncbi:hypothetical protein [Salinithrix halophila]|uniref:Uncharacterized protein n=1 Tax=Salinithrix halophila TaxID=1485204 RepID=A0ABV8JIR6_9BACL
MNRYAFAGGNPISGVEVDGHYIEKANLNISTGTTEHAEYFKAKRGGNDQIFEWDIPKWFDDMIREYAIPQGNSKTNPLNQGGAAPKIVDETTPGESFELPPPWAKWIE